VAELRELELAMTIFRTTIQLPGQCQAANAVLGWPPPGIRAGAENMRDCFVRVIEVIWEFVRPGIAELHAQGVRPMPNASDPGGWLPS
jgi:hypothetical protein